MVTFAIFKQNFLKGEVKMKKKLLTGLATGLFIVGMNGMASATILNFDDLEVAGPNAGTLANYSDQGFKITSSTNNFAYWQQGSSYYNTSAALFQNSEDGVSRLSAIGGSLFNLTSIDLDTVYADNGPSPVVFSGYDSTDQLIASEGLTLNTDGWITFNFTTAFSNLAYVEWTQTAGYHQIDNVAINENAPVPEPATMLLFGTGLAGLVGARLRRKK